jgi:hypothetical protein
MPRQNGPFGDLARSVIDYVIYIYIHVYLYMYMNMNIQIMRTTVLLVQQISSLQGCIPSGFHRREKDACLARADGQRFRL